MAQGAFSRVIGQRQLGMVKHLEDGLPIGEQFDR
jgi:hypothetical protein